MEKKVVDTEIFGSDNSTKVVYHCIEESLITPVDFFAEPVYASEYEKELAEEINLAYRESEQERWEEYMNEQKEIKEMEGTRNLYARRYHLYDYISKGMQCT